MRGARCKQLRKDFARKAGRPVSPKTYLLGFHIGATSEWRRLKSLWKRVKAR